MNNKDFSRRYETLIRIKEKLLERLGENIYCAIAYGSATGEDFYSESDFDILLFLKDCSFEKLTQIKEIKKEFQSENLKIDLNLHSAEEIPQKRKECFWHNNRSLYFQKEVTLYGITLIGENPFLHNNFSKEELEKESVRVINSLLYQARKLLINREITNNEKINLMKWCIYGVLYALSSKGIITKTKTEAIDTFQEYYMTETNPLEFLKAKQENKVSEDLIEKAYKFLEQLDKLIFKEYQNGRKQN